MPEQDYRQEALERVAPVPVRARFAPEPAGGRWDAPRWRLVAVEPCDPAEDEAAGRERLAIELFADEAEGYYLNLSSGDPSIFVKWRLPEDESGVSGEPGEPIPLAVTLSYNEAGRWMDGGERVERVPLPEEVHPWLAEFVKLHWKPEVGRKRRGPKPSFMRREEFAGMVEREQAGGGGAGRGDRGGAGRGAGGEDA